MFTSENQYSSQLVDIQTLESTLQFKKIEKITNFKKGSHELTEQITGMLDKYKNAFQKRKRL